jgi:hypothetical protein
VFCSRKVAPSLNVLLRHWQPEHAMDIVKLHVEVHSDEIAHGAWRVGID